MEISPYLCTVKQKMTANMKFNLKKNKEMKKFAMMMMAVSTVLHDLW